MKPELKHADIPLNPPDTRSRVGEVLGAERPKIRVRKFDEKEIAALRAAYKAMDDFGDEAELEAWVKIQVNPWSDEYTLAELKAFADNTAADCEAADREDAGMFAQKLREIDEEEGESDS